MDRITGHPMGMAPNGTSTTFEDVLNGDNGFQPSHEECVNSEGKFDIGVVVILYLQ